jgi:hypothetical protein
MKRLFKEIKRVDGRQGQDVRYFAVTRMARTAVIDETFASLYWDRSARHIPKKRRSFPRLPDGQLGDR